MAHGVGVISSARPFGELASTFGAVINEQPAVLIFNGFDSDEFLPDFKSFEALPKGERCFEFFGDFFAF
jgi:hypothetical protein